jgi:hypothetical protein
MQNKEGRKAGENKLHSSCLPAFLIFPFCESGKVIVKSPQKLLADGAEPGFQSGFDPQTPFADGAHNSAWTRKHR